MEKKRLLELLKSEPSDIDAIGMILSNHTDYGHSEMGGMVSVKQFKEVAECLIEWWEGKSDSTSENSLHKHIVIESAFIEVFDKAACIQHWHNTGRNDEGMVVSSDKVHELWEVLDKYRDFRHSL